MKLDLFPTGRGGSYQRCSIKKGVLNNFAKFNEKQLCQSLFFNKLPEASTFIKKETLAQVFSSEFCEIFKNTFFTEHCRTLQNFLRTLEERFYAWIVRDVFGTLSNVWDVITLQKVLSKIFDRMLNTRQNVIIFLPKWGPSHNFSFSSKKIATIRTLFSWWNCLNISFNFLNIAV